MSDPTPTTQINFPPAQSNDHDLLLTLKAELGTKLDRVIVDVKELKDNVAARVTDLEQEKVSKDEFDDFKTDAGESIDSLKKLVYIGLGIVVTLQFAIILYATFYAK